MGDVPHDLGPAALAADPLMQGNHDLVAAVDELLGLEAQCVECLHIRVEELLDPLFAVPCLGPVGGAFAVAKRNSGARRSRKASTPPSLNAS